MQDPVEGLFEDGEQCVADRRADPGVEEHDRDPFVDGQRPADLGDVVRGVPVERVPVSYTLGW